MSGPSTTAPTYVDLSKEGYTTIPAEWSNKPEDLSLDLYFAPSTYDGSILNRIVKFYDCKSALPALYNETNDIFLIRAESSSGRKFFVWWCDADNLYGVTKGFVEGSNITDSVMKSLADAPGIEGLELAELKNGRSLTEKEYPIGEALKPGEDPMGSIPWKPDAAAYAKKFAEANQRALALSSAPESSAPRGG